jgi:hypothetical protein
VFVGAYRAATVRESVADGLFQQPASGIGFEPEMIGAVHFSGPVWNATLLLNVTKVGKSTGPTPVGDLATGEYAFVPATQIMPMFRRRSDQSERIEGSISGGGMLVVLVQEEDLCCSV